MWELLIYFIFKRVIIYPINLLIFIIGVYKKSPEQLN